MTAAAPAISESGMPGGASPGGKGRPPAEAPAFLAPRSAPGGEVADHLPWPLVPPAGVRELLAAGGAAFEAAAEALVSPREPGRRAVAVEMVRNLVRHARAAGLGETKTAVALALLATAHAEAVALWLSSEQSLELLVEAVMRHSVQRPPASVAVFQLAEARGLVDFFISGYYRHSHLYQHAFRKAIVANVRQARPFEFQSPPVPAPLVEAEEERPPEPSGSDAEGDGAGGAAGEGAGTGEEVGTVSAAELEAAERALPPEMVGHIHRLLDQQLGSLRDEVGQRLEDAEQGLKNQLSGQGGQ